MALLHPLHHAHREPGHLRRHLLLRPSRAGDPVRPHGAGGTAAGRGAALDSHPARLLQSGAVRDQSRGRALRGPHVLQTLAHAAWLAGSGGLDGVAVFRHDDLASGFGEVAAGS